MTVSITVSRRNQILLRLNNQTVTFESEQNAVIQSDTITLSFANFSITKKRTSDQITLVWNVGISIRVTPIFLNATSALVLNVAAAVSGDLKGNSSFGLIGGYDGQAQNDLRIKNGTVIGTVETLSARQIHEVSVSSRPILEKYQPSPSCLVSLGLSLPHDPCSTMRQTKVPYSTNPKI